MKPALSRAQWIILDALWFNRVYLDWLFCREDTFVELFNIPWHHLDSAACCHALANLLERRYVEITQEETQGRFCITAGLTELGGSVWQDYFVNDLGLLIWDY